MGEFEHNSYKSVINESVGRSALAIVPAPFMDLSNYLDELIENERLNKNFKTPRPILKDEFTGMKLDGFRIVGAKYFKSASEDNLFVDEVESFEKEPEPNSNVKIFFSDGSAHVITDEKIKNTSKKFKKRAIKTELSIIEPEDLGFSPVKIKKTPKDEESREMFWNKERVKIQKRKARKNKQLRITTAAKNYFNQIIGVNVVDEDKYENWHTIFDNELDFAL